MVGHKLKFAARHREPLRKHLFLFRSTQNDNSVNRGDSKMPAETLQDPSQSLLGRIPGEVHKDMNHPFLASAQPLKESEYVSGALGSRQHCLEGLAVSKQFPAPVQPFPIPAFAACARDILLDFLSPSGQQNGSLLPEWIRPLRESCEDCFFGHRLSH